MKQPEQNRTAKTDANRENREEQKLNCYYYYCYYYYYYFYSYTRNRFY